MRRKTLSRIHPARPLRRLGLTVLAATGLVLGAHAQSGVALYDFSTNSGVSLHDTTGASHLLEPGTEVSAVTNIGFDFVYEGVTYTQFSANQYGSIRLGSSPANGTYLQGSLSEPLYLTPISMDVNVYGGLPVVPSVDYLVTGSAPNRVFVLQWNAWQWYTPNAATFQLALYEGSNQIEFLYGPGTLADPYRNFVAVTGANTANFLNVQPDHTASNSNGNYSAFYPGEGRQYLFTPSAPFPVCTTPAPGNTLASVTSGCTSVATTVLSLQNETPGTGVSYQWQSSPSSSGPWTGVGLNSGTYTATNITTTTWFRCEVTCSTGPSTVPSNPVEVYVGFPPVNYMVYSGALMTEDFSTWGNRCSTGDVPSLAANHWSNTPAFGAGTWRANNEAYANTGWNNIVGGPTAWNNGAAAPAARFHARQGNSVTGTLDFHVDMSAATGQERLRFVYWFLYNQYQATTANLQVQISTNGGANFTTLETLSTIPTNTWEAKEYIIGSTSAQTVIRLKGTANTALNGNDIAVDNFSIVPYEPCPTPSALLATLSGAGEAQVSWNCNGCTGNYYVEFGPTGFTPGSGATAGANGTVSVANSSPATITGIPAGNIDLYVRQNCSVDGFSSNSGPASFNMATIMDCSGAVDLSSLGLPVMDASFSTTLGTTESATNHISSSACFGYTPNKDIVFYQDVEPGATLHIGLWSYSSTLSVAYGESCPGTTSLACNPSGGGYFNAGTYVQNIGGYPTLVWTNASCETIRVYVVAEAITTGGDVVIFNYDYTAPAGGFCAVVANIAVNTVNTGTNAALSWDATCSGNVIVEYGQAGFTPGTDNTAGVGGTAVAVSGTSTTLSGLTLDQAYDVYVRQDCDNGNYSANGTATTFTLHNGDDCSRVIALSGANGSMTINTSGANNDVDFCNVGATGGDLILSYAVQDGYGIYFTSAPVSPYAGQVAIGAGTNCPGSTVLYCNAGAADYFWVNNTGSTVNVYFVQDGSDEGETTVEWSYLPACAFLDSDGDGISDCDDLCPSLPGQEGDPCTTGNGDPGVITNCECVFHCGGNGVVVEVVTDWNALDLSWEITDETNTVIASYAFTMADDATTVTREVCLSSIPGDACYGFRLMDSYGDGLAGAGSWELRTLGGKVLLRDDFATGSQTPSASPQTPSYGSGHSFCLPEGPSRIMANECNVFTNGMYDKVYCSKVTGATQYQFEFSNPDAGYMRRIARPHNYVVFYEMVSSPLVPGVKYFTRARTNEAGPLASAHWGSGCDLGLGIAQVVQCTQLIQAPAYGHSCNETRSFTAPYNYLYAKPVTGATTYTFKITGDDGNYNSGIEFVRNTYILALGWGTNEAPALTDQTTYQVQVRVTVNGIEGAYCGNVCNVTIDNNPNLGIRLAQTEGQPELSLWPNPTNGQHLNVALSGLDSKVSTADVRLMDLTGRVALGTQLSVVDGAINSVIELGNAANGTYLLQVIAGGNTYTQRVVVNK